MNHNTSENSGMGSRKANEPSTSANIAFQDVPLTALGKETLRRLSFLLNTERNFRSHDGYDRDWRGLARLSKQKCLCDENAKTLQDPITELVQLWCINNPKTATFAYLEKFLAIIERWDVTDEIYENLMADRRAYQMELKLELERNSKSFESNSENQTFDENFDYATDVNILTTDDVLLAQKGLPPQNYDAFVLYADADLNYAAEMLTMLEDQSDYSFKLCMKNRDLLNRVHMDNVALTQLIEERCKNLIIILTEEFLKSPENDFLINYTQTLQQEQYKSGKIITVLYEDSVNMPNCLEIYNHLRYSDSDLLDFWLKLANIMRNVNTTNGTTNATSLSRNRNTALRTPRTPRNLIQIKEDSELKIISSRGVMRIKDLPTSSVSSILKKKLERSSKILKEAFTRRNR